MPLGDVIARATHRAGRTAARRWLRYQDCGDVFDTSFWPWLAPLGPDDPARLPSPLPDARGVPWAVELPSGAEIRERESACHEATGFWPLSMSHPGVDMSGVERDRLVSDIVPGRAYSFTSPDDYYRAYAGAWFAVTHRKAGWDCFRHVEIMASGTVPLLLDADQVPAHNLVHYPLAQLESIVSHVRTSADQPSPELRAALARYFTDHLSTRAMTDYVLARSGLAGASRVLFVDRQLPFAADYISALAVIGLKQRLGSACRMAWEADYLYRDTRRDVTSLYGRGFGYAKVLDPSSRGRSRGVGAGALRDVDAVIVGSIGRNGPLAHRLLARFPAAQTVWLHGEDQPPSPREQHVLRESGAHVFVRAVP